MDSSNEKQESAQEFQFEIFITGDGSPTMSLADQNWEHMHHRDGALTESLYIYGESLEKVATDPLKILSVGLGLGYNEIIATAYALSQNKEDQLQILSFESESTLRNKLQNWLEDTHLSKTKWDELYNSILSSIAKYFKIETTDLKNKLLQLYQDSRWQIKNELTNVTPFNHKYNLIFFDAFSKATTPSLWDESFLEKFIGQVSDTHCVLTTYAATGALTRALKKNYYQVEKRKGFSGKRQSTLAIRNQFIKD